MGIFIAMFAIGLVGAFFMMGVVLYFLPTIIAYQRNHKSKNIICLINLFLGWTFLGWIACLVWSFIDNNG